MPFGTRSLLVRRRILAALVAPTHSEHNCYSFIGDEARGDEIRKWNPITS